MTDYNTRQLNLMLRNLDAIDNRTVNLGNIKARLEGLLNALEDVEKHWRNAFFKQWGVLEDVYADALDQNLQEIPIEHMTLVNDAIREIRKLIGHNLSE
jgi:hypothetical protein